MNKLKELLANVKQKLVQLLESVKTALGLNPVKQVKEFSELYNGFVVNPTRTLESSYNYSALLVSDPKKQAPKNKKPAKKSVKKSKKPTKSKK